jgi:hypothetical protein
MCWLGEALSDQRGRGLVPRTNKDLTEEQLFAKRRNLFNSMMWDWRSRYDQPLFREGGGTTLDRNDHSRASWPDLPQLVLDRVSARPEPWPRDLVPRDARNVLHPCCRNADLASSSTRTGGRSAERCGRGILPAYGPGLDAAVTRLIPAITRLRRRALQHRRTERRPNGPGVSGTRLHAQYPSARPSLRGSDPATRHPRSWSIQIAWPPPSGRSAGSGT